MAKTELDHVTKVYTETDGSEVVAVDDLSLAIDDGEFLVLVGPSGCGKSTTLRMIAGLESVTDGEIRLGGRVINDVPARDRDIAMVFQSYALYPHMTVRENMAFGLEESTELPDDEIADRVERTAEMMNIADLLDRTPGDLSGGQQQRVALGRAIVRDPAVFLLDEPLSNLDAKLRAQMRTELQRLQEDLDTTTIYVTHDQTEAMTMGDRIAILDGGVLQQVGTPLECYHEPANLFVAGFVGEPSMNFFDVDLRDGTLVGEHFEYPLSEAVRADVAGHDRLVLGIRPEDVELLGDAETAHDFPATVDVVEPMGDENQVHLALRGGVETGAEAGDESAQVTDSEQASLVATVSGMRRVAAGRDAVVRIPEDAVHLFDRETGEALRNRELESVEAASPNL
ncbi:sn-glycerol-3-phosphate ABC transporter ATP-binding protein UgpC [Halorussus salilacus]|uniref:ABC transporter ATP-binding protein n=1 Tax=Halorussus salilacus TaxID=2953750 RepID=UPI00209F782C|nr:sn-glycerol-3-phosphate ABC transporter ATP-binding protein UgpC [Halorussus salilacus]USZ68585.1 sn-glycerol-3-phosphate ABC transporter ATP-binding protein UgpC [Halorussus salilacus]